MQLDEARLREWANTAGAEAAKALLAADLRAIRVSAITPLDGTEPAEVRITWEAVLRDGSVRPGDFDFDIEIADLDDMGKDTFILIASQKLLGHLAYSVVEPETKP